MDSIRFSLPKDSKVIAISVNPFDRIGLKKYIHNFAIFGYEDGSWIDYARKRGEEITALRESANIELEKKNSESIIDTKPLEEFINQYDKVYLFLYKETQAISEQVSRKFPNVKILANSFELNSTLENKVKFREIFKDKITLPEFIIKRFDEELLSPEHYHYLTNKLGEKIVIQDEILSGGKGTFIVNNFDQYLDSLNSLKEFKRDIVFSQFIKGEICSIQCCCTQYGVISTGIQEQLISNKYLVNSKVSNGGTFCGGEFGYSSYGNDIENQAMEISDRIGSKAYGMGYRGIFGIDLMISNNKIYVLEMNPRITGLSLMVGMLQEQIDQIPLQLLHFLELAKLDYSVQNPDILNDYFNSYNKKGSFLVLQNRFDYKIKVKDSLKPGIYSFVNGKVIFKRDGYKLIDLKEDGEFIISGTPSNNSIKSPGSRVLRILTNNKVLDENNEILPDYIKVINFIESHYQKSNSND